MAAFIARIGFWGQCGFGVTVVLATCKKPKGKSYQRSKPFYVRVLCPNSKALCVLCSYFLLRSRSTRDAGSNTIKIRVPFRLVCIRVPYCIGDLTRDLNLESYPCK